jgi:predicted Zn finger-like uncharacterized protein
MSIVFTCPGCRARYRVNDRDAGRKSDCKRCGQRLQVPPPRRAKTVLGEIIASPAPERAKTVLGELPAITVTPAPGPETEPAGPGRSPSFRQGLPSAIPVIGSESASKARTGLLAFGFAGAIFAVIAVVVGIVVTAKRESGGPAERSSASASAQQPDWDGSGGTALQPKRDPPGAGEKSQAKTDLTGPVSKGPKDDDGAYVVGHRWWKTPPTRDKLQELIDYVISTPGESSVIIGDTGKTMRLTPFERSQYSPPELFIGGRWFKIDCDWAKRPNRDAVLKAMRSELDRVEYKQGPGR